MQWKTSSTRVQCLAIMLASLGMGMLAGCGVSGATPPNSLDNPVTLQGQVFAGRNYMAGATVKIYETQPTGTAQADGAYSGQAKLLTTLTANTTGGWSLENLSCDTGNMVYVTAEGGTPYPSGQSATTLAENLNSLMLTAIGDCALLSQAQDTNNATSIVTDEASTVAAVWSLRNFINLSGTTVNITSSATNYTGKNGVGVPGNYAGLAHAFLNANAISPYKIGNFVQYTGGISADGTGGGLVPVQELNSLAYVQYLCTIGSDGATSGSFSYCTELYQLATLPGGTAPTNSLAAMLNIAKYPANNATAILNFSLTPIPLSGQTGPGQTINAGVYVPALSAFGTLTNDWSVAIYYLPGYGANSTAQGSVYPIDLTIDANDSVYFSNPTSSTSTAGNIIALASNGQLLWASPTDSTNLVDPRGIAADASGHLWVVNGSSTGLVEEMGAASGNVIARFPSSSSSLYGVAVDSLGNVWYDANSTTGQNLHELALSNGIYSEATFPVPPFSSLLTPLQIRPDNGNNIWVAGYGSSASQVIVFPNTGTASAPSYTAPLLTSTLAGAATYGITLDAAGNAWSVPNGSTGGIYKTTMTGAGASATLQSSNVAANSAAASRYLDTDGAGSIWYPDSVTGTFLYQYIPSTGATNAYYPCYNTVTTTGSTTSQTCSAGISTRQSLAIDSTGSIWIGSYGNSGGGLMVQIIGLAAPAVPLKAMGKPGVMP